MSTKIFNIVIIAIVLLVIASAAHDKYEAAKAQVGHSIDQVDSDWQPSGGQG